MIQIEIDEAEAFDRLSICQIKRDNFKDVELKRHFDNQFKKMSIVLLSQLEDNIFNTILRSDLFQNLININQEIFDAVELAKKNLISAKEVDSLNVKRYNIKKQMQKTFFENAISDNKS